MNWTLFSFVLVLHPSWSECFLSGGQNSECHQWKDEFARNQATVTAKVPPDIQGKWVSDSCEVRPGPDFLLRRYQFFSNKSFVLQQFYYMDDSCTLPAYSITAWGHYHHSRASWIVPGAMETDYITTRVNLIAYSNDVADSLTHRINRSCPNHIRSNWRPYKRYRVYSYVESFGNGSRNDVIEDYDCLSSLHVTFNELQLMRVEHRKALHHRHKPHPTRIELFLGDVHNDVNKRNFYRPNNYQVPLLNSKSIGCHVCHLVSKSHELSPPQLPARPQLPVYLNGEWISTRCEIRPLGMFLTRQLQFDRDNWKGSYQYYADPNCASPTFLLEAEGKFMEVKPSNKFPGATDYNFNVYRGYLTLQKENFVAIVNRHGNVCGRSGSWEVNITQDVTSTGGCLNLGIRVPSVEYNVVKMDIDHHGNSLLYLGKLDTDFRPTSPSRRPTSYQLPLVQCRHISDNHLNPLPHALYLSSSCQSCSTINIVILLLFWILKEYK